MNSQMYNRLLFVRLILVGPTVAPPGYRLPASTAGEFVQPFEPFEASNGWLMRAAAMRSMRFWTPTDFEAHVLRCGPAQLASLCALRRVSPDGERSEVIKRILQGIYDEPTRRVFTEGDLRVLCQQAGLSSEGDRAALLARLSDVAPDLVIKPEPQEPSPEPEPAPTSSVDQERLLRLKVALEAQDYNQTWALATNLTATRPADKTKAVVMAWAAQVVRELEG